MVSVNRFEQPRGQSDSFGAGPLFGARVHVARQVVADGPSPHDVRRRFYGLRAPGDPRLSRADPSPGLDEAGIGQRGRLADGVAAFTGSLASRIVQLPPRDPESKGIVERANRFLETSFLPGRAFSDPDDFNAQSRAWLPKANQRLVRATGARPIDRLELDMAGMLPLPPITPEVRWHARVRLGRDYYVRVLGNDYSVDPVAIGRMIDVHADLEAVTVFAGQRLVAAHRRAWSRREVFTDPAHVQSASKLRAAFQASAPTAVDSDLVRDLHEYDHAFGLTTAVNP